jgi:Zn ribbon nucleic-acid-binding protein
VRIKHFSKGKFYVIQCPPGTRVVRCSALPALVEPDGYDHLVVPFEGWEIRIPADPPELLPLLAESGRCGLSLIGDPEPEMMLAGATCPNCGEDHVNWLSVEDGSETAHCDRCGSDFGLTDQSGSHASSSRVRAE